MVFKVLRKDVKKLQLNNNNNYISALILNNIIIYRMIIIKNFMMGTNLRGAFFVAQAVANRMLARAKARPEKTHRIINIASVAGLRVLSQIGVYCMSKAAVVQMTKAMALEWSRFNINVNAICPGYITTDMNASHWETEAGQKMMAMLPRRRVGKPEDLDALLLLLAGDGSDFINGAIITADDGLSVTWFILKVKIEGNDAMHQKKGLELLECAI